MALFIAYKGLLKVYVSYVTILLKKISLAISGVLIVLTILCGDFATLVND